ncbi:PREDICTED: uncharacterized protein LOC106748207 isoform X2 [Dinoponera quadriceps]|uniref:Uncharacterized protein LOC106748207 isoform X2 n=1 Tax=Dinoponera quadriceps TaxID=609295 RepID=A0A6P3XU20_DINQU|nr:PREDICTED: uncharacterized protein LOC106748207 isoform X2 [Dinoponera quadriceps]
MCHDELHQRRRREVPTGIKRILEGEVRPAASKADEGKLHVKYTTIPLTPETKYSVLETDYDSYAVLWSCQGIGPVHAQNAWVMTRERIPSGEVLQKAYGVLDKYKISKTFFVKTDQADCASLETPPPKKPAAEKPVAEEPAADEGNVSSRSIITLEDVENETKLLAEVDTSDEKATSDISEIIAQPLAVETVPERILKIAEAIKESDDAGDKMIIVEVKEEKAVESAKEEERNEQAKETEKTA